MISHFIQKYRNKQYSFLFLLISLVLLLLAPSYSSVAYRSEFTSLFLFTILLASLNLVSREKLEIYIGFVLLSSVLFLEFAALPVPRIYQITLSGVLFLIFFSYLSFIIFRYIFETYVVSADKIFAAICLYLILGLIWSFIYLLIEIWHPGSFTVEEYEDITIQSCRILLHQFLYFSFMTITTVGFGDITAATRVGRSWVMLEAVVGQFYLTVIIARLVALHISSSIKNDK